MVLSKLFDGNLPLPSLCNRSFPSPLIASSLTLFTKSSKLLYLISLLIRPPNGFFLSRLDMFLHSPSHQIQNHFLDVRAVPIAFLIPSSWSWVTKTSVIHVGTQVSTLSLRHQLRPFNSSVSYHHPHETWTTIITKCQIVSCVSTASRHWPSNVTWGMENLSARMTFTKDLPKLNVQTVIRVSFTTPPMENLISPLSRNCTYSHC